MRHKLSLLGLTGVALVVLLSFSSTPSTVVSTGVQSVAAQGPTPTPANDPVWNAFSAARSALENQLKRSLQFVQNWTWEDANFNEPISNCRTLQEGEQGDIATVGYRFIITTLQGQSYEVRTRFDSTYVVVCDGVTSTAAPVAQPANTGNNPAPVTAPVGRGGLEVGGQVTGLHPEARTAITQAGMRWVKIQADGGNPTALIQEAHGLGLKVLVSAIDKANIPNIMNPSVQDGFAAYVATIATSGADAIEVWNEPNIEREWPAGQISGGNYTQLLAKAYNAIKQANPNTIVISGATAPTGFFGAAGCAAGGCNDDVFYQQMAQAGAASYMDCVGVHYNEGVISPTRNSGDPRGGYGTYYYQSNLARAIGPFPGKQGCFTELGYLTPEGYGGLPGNFAWAASTTIANQAQWLGEVVSIAKQAGNVRILIVFNINFTTYTDDPQAGFAIIRKDGSCPACASIRAALG